MSSNALQLQRLLKRFFLVLVTTVILTFYILQFKSSGLVTNTGKNPWDLYDFSNIPSDKERLNETTVGNDVKNYIHSLPVEYWKTRDTRADKNVCGGIGSIYDIKFSNNFWQILNHSNGTFHFLNAYYDNRTKSVVPTVRVIATVNRLNPKHSITCQMWLDQAVHPVFAPVTEFKYMWLTAWGVQTEAYQQPYLISCDIPKTYQNATPLAVSLVERKCDKATNLLKVHNKKPFSGEKDNFAVCVKGLSFQYNDQSVILIEWLEYLFSMGVSKVFIYVLHVHANMWKVLQYYDSIGKIEVRRHALSGNYPNIPGFQQDFLSKRVSSKRLEELIPYNDCFYDNMNLYKFIALLDIDELIVPKGHLMTWKELQNFLEPSLKHSPEDLDGYGFRNVFFHDGNETYDGIPSYLRFTNIIKRNRDHHKVGQATKSWFSTENVQTLHNHYSFNLLSPDKKSRYKKWHEVDPNVAQMQHYCFNKKCDPTNVTLDNTLWKYKDRVVEESLKVLESLQFISKKEG
ncbi:hypothetical protein ACFFRR_007971 [Megaselia abdita]